MALSLIPGLGPRRILSLLNEVEDTEEIFAMGLSRIYSITGTRAVGPGMISKIRTSDTYLEELSYIEKNGIIPLTPADEAYPEALRQIYDPPAVIYCRGRLLDTDRNAVAIVGSRRCSLYGISMAERLARDLAQKGVTVVSGMAKGIDSAAHRGALQAGGRTIAVMGSGFRHVYPPGSENLAADIAANGAVVTEYASNAIPEKGNFPRRNRIISGMSMGVVVVEAARKSGAMITVDMALEQGKDVFAVPGRADTYVAQGTNYLIQNGAKLVTCAEDVMEELKIGSLENVSSGLSIEHNEISEQQRIILGIIEKAKGIHIDNISVREEIDPRSLGNDLLRLEIKGLVRTIPGKRYALA